MKHLYRAIENDDGVLFEECEVVHYDAIKGNGCLNSPVHGTQSFRRRGAGVFESNADNLIQQYFEGVEFARAALAGKYATMIDHHELVLKHYRAKLESVTREVTA